jgi:hypothetical protein
VGSSSKKGSSYETIRSAITAVPLMSGNSAIANLTNQDVVDIVAALGVAAPVNPISPGYLFLEGRLSLFRSASGTGTDDNIITANLKNYIRTPSNETGGILSIYESIPCNTSAACADIKFSTPMNPNASSIRRGYVTRFCEEALARGSIMLGNLLATKGITVNSAMTDQNVTALFQIFLPGRIPPAGVVQSLKAVGENGKQAFSSSAEGWRYMTHVMCISPASDLL